MKKCFTCFFLVFLIGASRAQQSAQRFVQEIHYLLYLPDNFEKDTSQRWPLLVFLHGSGESGTELEKVKAHGPPKLIGQGRSFPFIVVSPQATNGWKTDQLIGMIRDIKAKYRVDNERVYLTGLSMGGFGTWNLAAEFPDEFAAIAPICGGGDTSKVWKLRHMPVWCFHGAKDNVVPLSSSTDMINALKPYNPAVRFTVYPEANHDSWTASYDNDSLYTWLLSQKKFRYQEQPVRVGSLAQYAGVYVNAGDTITAIVRNDTLALLPNKGRKKVLVMKPAGDDSFFFDAGIQDDIRFVRDRRNLVNGFTHTGRDRATFRRLPPPKKIN